MTTHIHEATGCNGCEECFSLYNAMCPLKRCKFCGFKSRFMNRNYDGITICDLCYTISNDRSLCGLSNPVVGCKRECVCVGISGNGSSIVYNRTKCYASCYCSQMCIDNPKIHLG